MGKANRVYKLKPPKYFVRQRVRFQSHNNGNILLGTIMWVETHYSNDEAYHIYSIRPDIWNSRRKIHIGEKYIKKVEGESIEF